MRAVATTSFAAAGACWAAGQAVLPDLGATTSERYDAVAAARTAEGWSAALLLAAGCLLVLAAVAAARRTAEWDGRGARLLGPGAALVGLGGAWLVGGRGAFNLLFLRVTEPDVPREAALDVLGSSGGPAFTVLLLTLPCLLIGPVLLAVGLRRAGATGWAPLVCWVVGVSLFVATEFTIKAGEIAGIAVAAVALALLGRGVDGLGLRHSPDRRADSKAVAISSNRRS